MAIQPFSDDFFLPSHMTLAVDSQTVLVFRTHEVAEIDPSHLLNAVNSFFDDPPMVVLLPESMGVEALDVDRVADAVGIDTSAVAEARQAVIRLPEECRNTAAYIQLTDALSRVLG